jgi:taurine dehydrogenase small subunit
VPHRADVTRGACRRPSFVTSYDLPVSEATRRLIEAYDEAWNRQDLDAVCSFHADDVVFENHTAGERAEGADAVRAHIAGIFERWPSLRFRGRRLYTAAEFAVSEWTATATRPDGTKIEWDGVDVFPLRDGKIARKDVYSTSASPRVAG